MIVYNKITWYSRGKKGKNYCENCPRLKFVVDSKNTGPEGISLQQQKHSDSERDIAQKRNL